MLGIPIHYLLRHPIMAAADLAADPLEVCITVYDAYVAQREQRGPRCRYESDENSGFMMLLAFHGHATRLLSFGNYGPL